MMVRGEADGCLGIELGHLVERQVFADAVSADGGRGGVERQVDRDRTGRQQRARRLRIAQRTRREHLLEVHGHEGSAGAAADGPWSLVV